MVVRLIITATSPTVMPKFPCPWALSNIHFYNYNSLRINCFIWALCHLNLLRFSNEHECFYELIYQQYFFMAEWHATPSLQTVIPNCLCWLHLGIWNHLSGIRDLSLRSVILACQLSRQTWYLAILLPKCWIGGMRLYTPLMKLLKKVKATSFLNLQSFKSFNRARDFLMHLGKKKMPMVLPVRSKVNVIWFIWRPNDLILNCPS